jgi:hypothetical protein
METVFAVIGVVTSVSIVGLAVAYFRGLVSITFKINS